MKFDAIWHDIYSEDDFMVWKPFLLGLKQRILSRHATFDELLGEDFGVLAKPLEKPMEFDLIGIKRLDTGEYAQVRMWFGEPYAKGSEMLV